MWSPELGTVRLGLSEQHIALSRSTLWRPSAASAIHSCHAVRPPYSWSDSVESASDALQAAQAGRAALNVVLSGKFVRWQHLTGIAALSHPDELAAYARAQFAQVYGPRAQDWHIDVALPQPAHSTLACAMDRSLLLALQRTAQANGLRLNRVTPYFACAHDHWRNRIADANYWFGVVEPGYFTLGLVHDGQWRAVRGQRFTANLWGALQASVVQTGLACGVDPQAHRVLLAGDLEPPQAQAGFPVSWLQPTVQPRPVAPGWRLAWGL